jgi:beta-N-acetylhexosaminidase
MPVVKKSWKAMWAEDLAPYRELRAQVPFVMVAHASYPEVTKDKLPASLSRKWMQDVLRKKIGYSGLIISDDLEMGGVLSTGTIEDVAVETLRAGADMFLVCHNQELVWRGYEAVLRTAERDRKFAAHVEKAARRVLSFKKRAKELRGFATEPKPKVVEKLKKIVGDFTRIVDGGVIDDRLHTSREINV